MVESEDGGFVISGGIRCRWFECEDSYLLKIDGEGNKVWERTYSGERHHAIVEGGDGGVVGVSIVEGDMDVIRIDGEGEKIWENIYGDSDTASCVVRSGDGGFILGGHTQSFGPGPRSAYLLKVDGDGRKIWEKAYGGYGWDSVDCLVEAGDGEFLAAGYSTSFGAREREVYLLKVDGLGEKVWERTYGTSYLDSTECVVGTGDGGFFVAANAVPLSGEGSSLYFLKVDADGDVVWEWTYQLYDRVSAHDVLQCRDGGFLVVGAREGDVYLLKISGQGRVVWEKTFGGPWDDWAECVARTPDGFIVAGRTGRTASRGHDVYLLKVDNLGYLVWERTYGLSNNGHAERVSVVPSGDGGFITAGTTNVLYTNYVYLLRVDGEGNQVWERNLGSSNRDRLESIACGGDGSFVAAGYVGHEKESRDVYLFRFRDPDLVGVVCTEPCTILAAILLMPLYMAWRRTRRTRTQA
jgi:hypothetical protein